MKTVPGQIINYENMRQYCYTNAHLITGQVRGIILTFHGRGSTAVFDTDTPLGISAAEKGVVQIFPYCDPWAWMNRGTVSFTDALTDCIFEHFGLGEDTPIVSEGGSMGGLSALIYPLYSSRKIRAVAANCPPCDMIFHFTARPDIAKYLLTAYGGTDKSLQEVLIDHSPMHQLDRLPRIPYYIIHGLSDTMIVPGPNSERFCKLLKEKGFDVVYVPVEGMGHCNTPREENDRYYEFVFSFFE